MDKSACGTMDFSFDVWTPSSHSMGTAPSIWQQAMPPTLLCSIIPRFWHGILSLLGCQYSPPPSVVGSAMLHPRHHPLLVSLRFSLARRQCPFLGSKYWREPHKRINLSLFPQSSPYSADHHGPAPTCNGYFFVPSSTKFSVCSATQIF